MPVTLSAAVRPRRALTAALIATALPTTVLAAGPAHAEDCDDTCRIDAARAYVDALASHDPSDVPLDPEATRVEAGLQTGFSGEQIRTDLHYGPQYRVIRRIVDPTYRVEDGTVIADFGLDVGLGPLPVTSARVHETFTLRDGGLHRIVADIRLGG